MKRLNLGSGDDYRDGWVNVDRGGRCDVVHDLDMFPYPFCDCVFDMINADHVFEHLLFPKRAIDECFRILKPSGVLYVSLPPYSCSPEHKSMVHNELYLRNLYVTPIYGSVHPSGVNVVFSCEEFGYSEPLPLPRMFFQMFVRFRSWLLSFRYNSIYWRLRK